MKQEYVIINKTAIQQRIEELENKGSNSKREEELDFKELKVLKQILSQSTPFIPEIEEAFHEGTRVPYDKSKPLNKWWVNADRRLEKYISNLKLNI